MYQKLCLIFIVLVSVCSAKASIDRRGFLKLLGMGATVATTSVSGPIGVLAKEVFKESPNEYYKIMAARSHFTSEFLWRSSWERHFTGKVTLRKGDLKMLVAYRNHLSQLVQNGKLSSTSVRFAKGLLQETNSFHAFDISQSDFRERIRKEIINVQEKLKERFKLNFDIPVEDQVEEFERPVKKIKGSKRCIQFLSL